MTYECLQYCTLTKEIEEYATQNQVWNINVTEFEKLECEVSLPPEVKLSEKSLRNLIISTLILYVIPFLYVLCKYMSYIVKEIKFCKVMYMHQQICLYI